MANLKVTLLFCLLPAAFAADCMSSSKQRCLRKSEVGGLGQYMASGDPCFEYQKNRWCFVSTSGSMQSCTCTPECGCKEAKPPLACDSSMVPKNPDCTNDKTTYCPLTEYNPIDKKTYNHTMCIYCGVDMNKCNKVCARGLSEEEKTLIVKVHNDYRRKVAKGLESQGVGGPQPSATNMYEIKWFDELSTIAQRWTDQCTSGHDKNRKSVTLGYSGQNIASSWSSQPIEDKSLENKIKGWYDEVKNLSPAGVDSYPSTAPNGVIGHYTQLVWAETKFIGCGFISSIDTDVSMKQYPYKQVLVCNYAPGGNMLGRPIYKKGTPASQCPKGDNDKLCLH